MIRHCHHQHHRCHQWLLSNHPPQKWLITTLINIEANQVEYMKLVNIIISRQLSLKNSMKLRSFRLPDFGQELGCPRCGVEFRDKHLYDTAPSNGNTSTSADWERRSIFRSECLPRKRFLGRFDQHYDTVGVFSWKQKLRFCQTSM